jgi:hypothetical protein
MWQRDKGAERDKGQFCQKNIIASEYSKETNAFEA